jgi:NAD(P)-dependent dehydrogenase (short-subunit alcohol dehydrogenase family)
MQDAVEPKPCPRCRAMTRAERGSIAAVTKLAGKTAIVTGGASGIGAALAGELVRRGAAVVIADRQVEEGRALAERLAASGGRARAVELDVRDLEAQERVVSDTIAREGRVDLFFANAGIGVGGEMDGYAREDWDDVIDVNVRGVAYSVQAVYPHMVRQRAGHIVTTASMAGLVGAAGEGSYTAAKHAVVGLSKSLRVEAKRHGVRVSVLCPGAIRTPILTGGRYGRLNFDGLTEETMLELWAVTRPMDPDELAQKTLDAVARNESIIVFPRWWKALWWLERVSPAASELVWSGMLAKLRKDLETKGVTPRTRRS